MSYGVNRTWSDTFLPDIKRIVGPYLLVRSPKEIDCTQAADLIVMRARDMTIAARIRRFGYAGKYPYDFTIRSSLDSGTKTELAKFLEGWGDWMFYGHAQQSGEFVDRWWLIDLHEWRKRLLFAGYRGGWSSLAIQIDNGDGTHFFAFDVRDFGSALLIGSSHPLPSAQQCDAKRVEAA